MSTALAAPSAVENLVLNITEEIHVHASRKTRLNLCSSNSALAPIRSKVKPCR